MDTLRTSYDLLLRYFLQPTLLVSSSSKITAAFVVVKPMSSTALMTLLTTTAAIPLWSCFSCALCKAFRTNCLLALFQWSYSVHRRTWPGYL